MRNGEVSQWFAQLAQLGRSAPRAPLAGETDADVGTVGAGLTGLWAPHYLAETDPPLRIMVCEQRFAGYGVSGRNGGWLTSSLAGTRRRFAATHGREGVLALPAQMHDAVGGAFTRHGARLNPAKPVVGLAVVVERQGVVIAEDTPVTGVVPGAVTTTRGTVRAPVVLRATESFTARLPGQRRTWLPMKSSLVVTEPLPDTAWEEIGRAGLET